jgi:hypothetical protein
VEEDPTDDVDIVRVLSSWVPLPPSSLASSCMDRQIPIGVGRLLCRERVRELREADIGRGTLTMGAFTNTRSSFRLQRWSRGRLDEERRWRDSGSGDGCVEKGRVVRRRGRALVEGVWDVTETE